MDIATIDPQAVKDGFGAIKSAIDTIKSLRDMFRDDPAKHKLAGDQIELAERQLRLAEAQVAQALGYQLCRAHFPPIPMLNARTDADYVEAIYRCPECGKEEPPPEYFEQRRRVDAAVDRYNRNLPRWP